MQRRKNTAAICKRVSANAAVSPRCLCVPSFGSLAVGRTRFCFVWFSSQICFVKESVPVSAERSDAACIKTGTRNIVILLFLQSDFIKQSVLLCRVNRQISVKFICLVEAKKRRELVCGGAKRRRTRQRQAHV